MTLYSTDSFSRSDSTTNLGVTDGAGTLDPLTWTQNLGVWGISTNRAYSSAPVSNVAVATVDLGVANVDLSLTTVAGTSALVFRYTDNSNYWYWFTNPGANSALYRREAGTDNLVGFTGPSAAGDVMRVVANGNSIQAYRNGTLQVSTTNSFNNTATKHGMRTVFAADFADNWSASSASSNVFLTESLSDTVGIIDAFAGAFTTKLTFNRAFSDTVGITEALGTAQRVNIADSVGIVGVLKRTPRATITDTVGIEGTPVFTGVFVQFDTWRPVTNPDNSLVLVCRTPLTEHDTYTGLTHLALWTIRSDGTGERPEVLQPVDNGYGWDSYSHPEWSPAGDEIVVAAETATEYELVVLDATGFGT